MQTVNFAATEEWGEGKGEGIPISRANSMEVPLSPALPARASQGEGAVGFRDGGSVKLRRRPFLRTLKVET